MDGSRQLSSAVDGQKGKNMSGKHNATDHEPDRTQKHCGNKRCLCEPVCIVSSPEQTFTPIAIEDMVPNEQNEHPYPDPFMNNLPH
jgi:hypothetical protein